MADDVQINVGTGGVYAAADDRSIGGVQRLVQRVGELGGSAIATGQVAPTTTAATLIAARDTRKVVTLYNAGTVDVYIGPATVTAANGFKLGVGASFDLSATALIQAITASGTGSVHYCEIYDA